MIPSGWARSFKAAADCGRVAGWWAFLRPTVSEVRAPVNLTRVDGPVVGLYQAPRLHALVPAVRGVEERSQAVTKAA
jgi:hypothetical protein